MSRLTDQSKVLAQRLALLEERVGPARSARGAADGELSAVEERESVPSGSA